MLRKGTLLFLTILFVGFVSPSRAWAVTCCVIAGVPLNQNGFNESHGMLFAPPGSFCGQGANDNEALGALQCGLKQNSAVFVPLILWPLPGATVKCSDSGSILIPCPECSGH
jgi:hypothetical protein